MRALVLILALALHAAVVRASDDTVIWISIDGLRADYVVSPSSEPVSSDLPFFQRLIAEGAWTTHLRPVFPSLTFPNHVSQATGVPVDQHGISSNTLFIHGRQIRYPAQAGLLLAEPIWHTAQRQGIPAAVIDWPLSQNQIGPLRSAHFDEKFDASLSDPVRLQRVLDIWKTTSARLIMGYAGSIDRAGHKYGPDASETREAVRELDSLLADFLQKALDLWKSTASSSTHLYLILTTDHGMAPVTHKVNSRLLIGSRLATGIDIVTSGNIANIHLDDLPENQRPERIRAIIEAVAKHVFARAYTRETLPPEWHYAHPERTGDVVLVLAPGHTFAFDAEGTVSALGDGDEPRGMHGYAVEAEPRMEGFAAIWRTPDSYGGIDLGPVSNLQFHPTVAKILGIAPAPTAATQPIDLPTPPQ